MDDCKFHADAHAARMPHRLRQYLEAVRISREVIILREKVKTLAAMKCIASAKALEQRRKGLEAQVRHLAGGT